MTLLFHETFAPTRSLLESKHLVVCKSEVSSNCEERLLLSWWALIGVAEIAESFVIWYVQVAPSSKWWSNGGVSTEDGIRFISRDERHFRWAQATWVYQAK